MFLEKFDPLKNQTVQILDQDGNHKEDLIPKELTNDVVKQLYENLWYVRLTNHRALKMQRQGRMGTFASVKGQEACQLGSEYAIKKTDWIVPAFREQAAMWAHGVPMDQIYLYWKGNEWGAHFPEGVKVMPHSIPVGSQMLHAVGLSWAAKMRGEDQIAVTYFGDGATSEGDFHEAMNFAGVFKTPTIFICQNNQYAISVPRRLQTASQTLAQKAIAYGFPGVLVDGNDLFAMYAVTKEAAERARKGEGPTLIEAHLYRFDDHTTSDDATKYRTEEEVKNWEPRDAVFRLQKYLAKKGIWSEKYEAELQGKLAPQVEEMVKKIEEAPDPTPDDIFSYTYAEMTQEQQEQKKYLEEILAKQKE